VILRKFKGLGAGRRCDTYFAAMFLLTGFWHVIESGRRRYESTCLHGGGKKIQEYMFRRYRNYSYKSMPSYFTLSSYSWLSLSCTSVTLIQSLFVDSVLYSCLATMLCIRGRVGSDP
jgi:hypothetical protein